MAGLASSQHKCFFDCDVKETTTEQIAHCRSNHQDEKVYERSEDEKETGIVILSIGEVRWVADSVREWLGDARG